MITLFERWWERIFDAVRVVLYGPPPDPRRAQWDAFVAEHKRREANGFKPLPTPTRQKEETQAHSYVDIARRAEHYRQLQQDRDAREARFQKHLQQCDRSHERIDAMGLDTVYWTCVY